MLSSEVHFHTSVAQMQINVMQNIVGEELAQSPYMVAKAGFEPVTFRMQGTEPYPLKHLQQNLYISFVYNAVIGCLFFL